MPGIGVGSNTSTKTVTRGSRRATTMATLLKMLSILGAMLGAPESCTIGLETTSHTTVSEAHLAASDSMKSATSSGPGGTVTQPFASSAWTTFEDAARQTCLIDTLVTAIILSTHYFFSNPSLCPTTLPALTPSLPAPATAFKPSLPAIPAIAIPSPRCATPFAPRATL